MQPQHATSWRGNKVARWLVPAAILLALVVFGNLFTNLLDPDSDSRGAPVPTATDTTPTASPTPELEAMQDRPGWDSMAGTVQELHDEYVQAREDRSILDLVPATDEGREYAEAFVILLRELHTEVQDSATDTDEDPGELDRRIEAYRSEARTLENRFLANEDLGSSVDYTYADGDRLQHDGSAPRVTSGEVFAQNFPTQADADGSYIGPAEELAAAFGISLTVNWEGLADACPNHQLDPNFVAAAYCSGSPTLIYLNEAHPSYPGMYRDPYFVELIRHELGHHRIAEICGTTQPPIAGDRFEGVTSSFAVAYLGASRDQMNLMAQEDQSYRLDAETDAIAAQIHDEHRCS